VRWDDTLGFFEPWEMFYFDRTRSTGSSADETQVVLLDRPDRELSRVPNEPDQDQFNERTKGLEKRKKRRWEGEGEDSAMDEEAYDLRGIDTSTHDLQANLKKWSSVRRGSEATVLCVCPCEREWV
jgi:hypothetical protein